MNSVKLQDIRLIYRSLVAFLYTNNELQERESRDFLGGTEV